MILNLLKRIKKLIDSSVKNYGAQYTLFGIFGIFNYPIYYLIWLYAAPQTYESLTLRLTATSLCLFLALNQYWSTGLKKFLPVYWYITLTYCLPFFFTFMLIKNHGAIMWVANTILIIFFLMFLVDWLSCIILLFIGGVAGVALAYLTTDMIWFVSYFDYLGFVITYIIAVVIGALFSHNKQMMEQQKLQTMQTLAIDIAHELRTPLATINAAAIGTKQYLPDLISAYQSAKDANFPVKNIRQSQIELLYTAMDDISTETRSSNNFINMLLTNVGQQNIDTSEFSVCSIADCINEALHRYPFHPDERELIIWNAENDFNFLGNELLTNHILFNLLKNAIYYIKAAHKGNIHIWLERKIKYNQLHFQDTGKGISANILPNIFDIFFSKTYHGSGIGLAFCSTVMKSFGGKIECKSVEGEFTEFILSFPKIKQL